MNKKDYKLGFLSGLLIGILSVPLLSVTKPDLYAKVYLYLIPFFLIATPLGLAAASLIGRKIAVIWQLGKFGVIGVLNTLVDWGVLAILIMVFRDYFTIDPQKIFLSLSILAISYYVIYKSISFVVAVTNSYYWNKYWTFSEKIREKTRQEFLQFFLVSIVGFFINVGISSYIFGAINPVAGLNMDQWGILGAAVGSVAGLAWNFLGYKFVVFKR